jgi:mono/diheme cytochrome c family protein
MHNILKNPVSGVVLMAALFVSCGQEPKDPGIEYAPQMYHTIPDEPLEQEQKNQYTEHGANWRKPVNGTVPRGKKEYVYPFSSGNEGYEKAGEYWSESPVPATPANLAEGKKLYETFCPQCHGCYGKNDGPVLKVDLYPKPAWGAYAPDTTHPAYDPDNKREGYQSSYIRTLSPGKIYHTITWGRNAMGAHASQIEPRQRWLIINYVKYLSKLSEEEIEALDEEKGCRMDYSAYERVKKAREEDLASANAQ